MRVFKSISLIILFSIFLLNQFCTAQSQEVFKNKLDFRILVKIGKTDKSPVISVEQFKRYKEWLQEKGPLVELSRGDEFQWFELEDSLSGLEPVAVFQGKRYVLLSTLPPFAMPADYTLYGGHIWGLTKVFATKDKSGKPAISLELDKNGTKILWDLCEVNHYYKNKLAILINDRMVSVLDLRDRIRKNLQITGTFTQKEVRKIVSLLKAAMPPVKKKLCLLKPFKKGLLPSDELLNYWARMLESSVPETRLAAVKDMWHARHETTAAMLLSAVHDPNAKVSKEAMYMTEMNQQLDIHTPAEPILELLKSDQSCHRAHGARLMNSHHEPQKLYGAAVAATSDSDGVVREWAFRYFKKNVPPDLVKQNLIHAVVEDPIWRTRAIAAETLYHLGIPQAAPALMTVIENGTLGGPAFRALITCGNKDTVDFILNRVESKNPETRRCAINTAAWAKWFPLDLRDATLIKAADDPNIAVRTWTYELIGYQKVLAASTVLRQKIIFGEDIDQESLFFGLSRIADRESGRLLLYFVQETNRIGELALEGVAHSGNDSLIDELVELIEKESDENEKWKERLASAICEILRKNPDLIVDNPEQSEQVKIIIKEKSLSVRFDKITLYRPNLAVVDVNFFQRGERWLLRQTNGRWQVLVKFGTWVV
jgi:HEAT repeat protein